MHEICIHRYIFTRMPHNSSLNMLQYLKERERKKTKNKRTRRKRETMELGRAEGEREINFKKSIYMIQSTVGVGYVYTNDGQTRTREKTKSDKRALSLLRNK